MLSTWYKLYNHQDQGLNFIKHTNIVFHIVFLWLKILYLQRSPHEFNFRLINIE